MKKIQIQQLIIRWICLFSSIITLEALAHDTFLLPVQENYPIGSNAEIRISSGLAFPEQTWGIDESRIEFTSLKLNEEIINSPTFALSKEYLSIGFTAPKSGLVTVALSTKVRSGAIDNENVDGYLEEIGASARLREAFHALPGKPALQRSYVKHTKTFLCVELCDARLKFMAKPVGQKLEFVGTRESESIFVLVYEGKPLSNHPVEVKNVAKETITLITDPNGKVNISGTFSGTLMLAAIALSVTDEPEGPYHSDQATLVLLR
ncbi:DUF4198 domain-containing protein [Alteromonas sp. ASW11-36]|uniref:DUF4198 domain-containing protein n=1 Tax=Alteromonas arenosi TaxID=3055817 RepID=A0ABT7SXV4_9ALTE|nr:DUF4198 domain-containing protein [Alteromonas sp. ASW11-36]MDM7860369.1 DUF4198 domain-containing protein [Alteromonas sp. ASW11-36]